MISYLTHGLINHLIYFQLLILVVILSNIIILHRARLHNSSNDFPFVSILIPARNEERSIGKCIQSLLQQDYPSYEIIALDDQSNDRTGDILERLASNQPNMKVLVGGPAPKGFSGKNWACSQLANQARGDLLLFTDADTIYTPKALRFLVSTMIGEETDLLTGFPRQQVCTWGERLLVPFFSWAFLCFFPLWLSYRIRLPALSTGVGQMMLFRREAYQMIGGHALIGNIIVEDMALGRRIKAAGMRWRVVHVTDLITCRMYHSSKESLDGFSRNLFAAFDFRLLIYIFVFLWLAVLFLEPLIVLAVHAIGHAPSARLGDLLVCICLSLLIWIISNIEMRVPIFLGLLYPLTILANEAVAFWSLCLSLTGRLSWKGRRLSRPIWKWL